LLNEQVLADLMRAIVDERLAALDAPPEREWLTRDEAADHLRLSERTLDRLVARGEVRSALIEGRRIFRREWLDEFAAAREEVAPTTPPRRRKPVPYAVPTTPNGGRQHAR